MTKSLLAWAADQAEWVQDSLRRIALATDNAVSDTDLGEIVEGIKHAAGIAAAVPEMILIDASHLGAMSSEKRRTVLTQLGPVQHIDRLAPNQRLRVASNGITLVYGENGSGKSGYTRIAKRLCRSLAVDELRGNVFAPSQSKPMSVLVRYQIGDDEITSLEWNPSTTPPSELRQISVFDSQNARLYVDAKNKIAYLPKELAILEHHGDICQRLGQQFTRDGKQVEDRLTTKLPAGYTSGTTVTATLAKIEATSTEIPSEESLRSLSSVSDSDLDELASLEKELALDPVALAAIRRRGTTLLKRVSEVLFTLDTSLSADIDAILIEARKATETASTAAKLAAADLFASEPIPNVGGDSWRILYEAARTFARTSAETDGERLPDAEGDLCILCQEPLSPNGAQRLARFNAFVQSEASRLADAARDRLNGLTDGLAQVAVPDIEVVAESLKTYGEIGAGCATIVKEIVEAITNFGARKIALLDGSATPPAPPHIGALQNTIAQEQARLNEEATAFENNASHATALDAKRLRLAELKDRIKLNGDLDIVLRRRTDAVALKEIRSCIEHVNTRTVSTQITALRKLLVTQELAKQIDDEIRALDLGHVPFQLSESSSAGQSLFAIGLKGAGQIKNNQILSEGEQRALALACFLAEIGGDSSSYGLIVDDPVSSLDHIRIRRVAKRLVAEATKGRQVIIFTHNIVFFNEIVSEAARLGDQAPLVKSVIRKTQAEGFGVIEEDCEPWVADLGIRIEDLRKRANEHLSISEFDTEYYRRLTKDFYSDLRESWERAVEELVLAKTIVRFVPDVMTMRLKEVCVDDEDYRTIYFAMKRVSERSGHDMSAGRDLPPPTPLEMKEDLKNLEDFRTAYRTKQKKVSAARAVLESPQKATLT